MAGASARLVRQGDVRAMLGFISELSSLETPDEFRSGALPGLRALVPCLMITYNEVDFASGRMVMAEDPVGAVIEGGTDTFVRLGHQNPLIPRYQQTRDGRPYKWSDLITRRELHSTELYRAAYRPMKIEYQMAFCLPAPPELIIGFALSRDRPDFSERDRGVLNLVRGPMIQAYRTVQRYAAVVERLNAAERGLDRAGLGVVVLSDHRGALRPEFVSHEAGRALEIDAGEGVELPPAVAPWLNARVPGGGTDRAPFLHRRRDGSTVAIQFMPSRRPGEPDTLLTEPTEDLVSTATLRAAGLTQREAEVLRLVALGRSNAQIASSLSISLRTVEKHLQNIYDKLGARSRTQAVLTAWSIGRVAN